MRDCPNTLCYSNLRVGELNAQVVIALLHDVFFHFHIF